MKRSVVEWAKVPLGPVMIVELVKHELDDGQVIYSVTKLVDGKFERLYGNIQTLGEARDLFLKWSNQQCQNT
jgi:hypothetical protein